ncbi:MAG: segregation/condensation protein A [Ignavibacteriae bacterium]|nr:segregation/condensation protein A [Ignavibacteriota bacterium]
MYTVKLRDFQGPLDLLLFFIKRDELDIYNIPISKLTKEFFDYLHYMRELDLEIAGDFLVMAAELMEIKAKLLLPPEPGQDEEDDPRANLVKRLIEYKRFKEVATDLVEREDAQMKVAYRGYTESDPRVMEENDDEQLLNDVSLFDLIASFQFAVQRMPKKFVHEIQRLNVSIDEQIAYIRDFFSRRSEATFSELIEGMQEKIRVVVTFIALLEVIRSKDIIVRQPEPFSELSIMRNIT